MNAVVFYWFKAFSCFSHRCTAEPASTNLTHAESEWLTTRWFSVFPRTEASLERSLGGEGLPTPTSRFPKHCAHLYPSPKCRCQRSLRLWLTPGKHREGFVC